MFYQYLAYVFNRSSRFGLQILSSLVERDVARLPAYLMQQFKKFAVTFINYFIWNTRHSHVHTGDMQHGDQMTIRQGDKTQDLKQKR